MVFLFIILVLFLRQGDYFQNLFRFQYFLVCALVLLSVNLRKNKKNDYEKSISEAALIFNVSGLIFSFSFLIRPTLIFVTFVPFLISFINIFYYLINSKNYFLSLSKKLPLLKNFFSRTTAFF